jgi:type IV pilus assembly protein PilM
MSTVGLDIGNRKVKVVSLSAKGKGKYKLDKWGVTEIPKGAILSGSESSWERISEEIKKLMADAKISERQVVVSLPENEEVYTKLMIEPKMTDAELKSAIPWEAEQYIPVPLGEVNYSFEVIGERGEGGGLEVLLIAANKRLVAKYERILEMAGLVPVTMETELLALTRCLTTPGSQDTVMVVDLGVRLMSMGVVRKGKLVLARSVPTAGDAMTRAIVTGLALSEDQAESFKCSYGLDKSQLEGKVAGVLMGVIKAEISEIKKTINFYQSKQGVEPVMLMVLTGGGSRLPEITSHLAQGLGIEVQLGNPLARVDIKEDEKQH